MNTQRFLFPQDVTIPFPRLQKICNLQKCTSNNASSSPIVQHLRCWVETLSQILKIYEVTYLFASSISNEVNIVNQTTNISWLLLFIVRFLLIKLHYFTCFGPSSLQNNGSSRVSVYYSAMLSGVHP